MYQKVTSAGVVAKGLLEYVHPSKQELVMQGKQINNNLIRYCAPSYLKARSTANEGNQWSCRVRQRALPQPKL